MVRSAEPFKGVGFARDVFGTGSSAGRAAAVLVKAFRTRNANIGDKSSVPPSGGIIPRNMFKYGSHSVLKVKKTMTISKATIEEQTPNMMQRVEARNFRRRVRFYLNTDNGEKTLKSRHSYILFVV